MKIYNIGTDVFEFQHSGGTFQIFPKEGTFERQKEAYTVDIPHSRGGVTSLKRFRDKWVKLSEEGTNSNFVEVPGPEFFDAAMRRAAAVGAEHLIKKESEIIKKENDRVAAIELKNKKLEAELAKQEQELNLKMAMLKKVEEEAISKAASKHK